MSRILTPHTVRGQEIIAAVKASRNDRELARTLGVKLATARTYRTHATQFLRDNGDRAAPDTPTSGVRSMSVAQAIAELQSERERIDAALLALHAL